MLKQKKEILCERIENELCVKDVYAGKEGSDFNLTHSNHIEVMHSRILELANARNKGRSIQSTEDGGTRSHRDLEGEMTCVCLI